VGIVNAQFAISLDGFIAGPNDEIDQVLRWYSQGILFDNLDGKQIMLEPTRVIEGIGVTHLLYRVVK
jgi:hypothetical protein